MQCRCQDGISSTIRAGDVRFTIVVKPIRRGFVRISRHDRRPTLTGTRREQHGSQETSEKETRPDNGRDCLCLEHDPLNDVSRCDRYDGDGRDIGIGFALPVRGEAII
jgi:hypothetical protein